MNRVICVGNALVEGDRAGAEAFALMARTGTPPGVEAVDGGLAGLGLLGALEGCANAVFIDSVRGFGAPGAVVVLAPEEAAAAGAYDHAAGLSYLLGVYPRLLPPPLPRVSVVGVEEPCGEASVAEAVRVALALAGGADVAPPV